MRQVKTAPLPRGGASGIVSDVIELDWFVQLSHEILYITNTAQTDLCNPTKNITRF